VAEDGVRKVYKLLLRRWSDGQLTTLIGSVVVAENKCVSIPATTAVVPRKSGFTATCMPLCAESILGGSLHRLDTTWCWRASEYAGTSRYHLGLVVGRTVTVRKVHKAPARKLLTMGPHVVHFTNAAREVIGRIMVVDGAKHVHPGAEEPSFVTAWCAQWCTANVLHRTGDRPAVLRRRHGLSSDLDWWREYDNAGVRPGVSKGWWVKGVPKRALKTDPVAIYSDGTVMLNEHSAASQHPHAVFDWQD
jgi:hypothetical protein